MGGLAPAVCATLLRDLTADQIEGIKGLGQAILNGELTRLNSYVTNPRTASFFKLLGGQAICCMRFLKVAKWKKEGAMIKLVIAIVWYCRDYPLLKERSRDVLDEFNAVPEQALFPCVGSYYKNKEFRSFDSTPCEFWRCSKLDLGALFGKYSFEEIELAYVNYIVRKEVTCRRCKAVGVLVLVDAQNAKLARLAWQTGKLRQFAGIMGKYGET